VEDEKDFIFTYGDGLSDVNVTELVEFHRGADVLATVTAVQPAGRFGALEMAGANALVESFQEKPRGDGAWINGGYFVLSPDVGGLIAGDGTSWEEGPLKALADERQLVAYRHDGFWQPMDTLRDRMILEQMWESGNAPWKSWE
jgi:glucose-1-phosphate cytidylyltransferase